MSPYEHCKRSPPDEEVLAQFRPCRAGGASLLLSAPPDSHGMIPPTTETDILAWTWQNHYGARVFATTLGHPRDFAVPQIMRIVVNGIHWAARVEVPDAASEIRTFDLPLDP